MTGVQTCALPIYWQVRWDVTEAVKLAFDEARIEIPFNQMDVHIINESKE